MAFSEITTEQRILYKKNLKEALALKKLKLSANFTREAWDGGDEAHVVDIYKTSGARKNAPEGSVTPEMNMDVEPVMLQKDRWDDGFKIKKAHQFAMLQDLTSTFYTQMMTNIRRGAEYDTCLGAFFKPRIVKNTDGSTTTVNYDNTQGNAVAVNFGGSNSGLTLGKLARGIRLLVDNDVNIEDYDIQMVLTADEAESLFNEEKLQNRDYIVFKADGEMQSALKGLNVPSYRGIMFHVLNDRYNKLAVTGQSTYRRLPMFTAEHMHYIEYGDIAGNLALDPAHSFIPTGHAEQFVGAGRSQDKGVVEITVLKTT